MKSMYGAHLSLETKFTLNFQWANPLILLTLLIAIILNVFGKLTRPWSNATLELLNLVLKTALGSPGGSNICAPLTFHQSVTEPDYIPCDICSVHKKINLEPSTRMHATCVQCSCTYPPIAKKKGTVYPERCTFKKYHGSKPCGQLLVKFMKSGDVQLTVLIRPFIVQDYNDFLAGLLSRPGMEAAME